MARRKFRLPARLFFLLIIIFLMAVSCLNAYVYLKGSPFVYSSIDDVPKAQAAIILGAGVTQTGKPSSVLEDRLVMAIKLYSKAKVSKIIMSGGNPTVAYNEVNPIQKILIQNNIPAQDIFLDHAGFDTYSTMYRARQIFKVTSAIIVTQAFHLPRALYIARSLGITAYGYPADRGAYSVKNSLRELISRPKSFFDVFLHRVPKYLGKPIPITGNGASTL